MHNRVNYRTKKSTWRAVNVSNNL